jgi:hypothetical protein
MSAGYIGGLQLSRQTVLAMLHAEHVERQEQRERQAEAEARCAFVHPHPGNACQPREPATAPWMTGTRP